MELREKPKSLRQHQLIIPACCVLLHSVSTVLSTITSDRRNSLIRELEQRASKVPTKSGRVGS